MSSYIVDSFSDVLSQEDVLDLFGRLQASAGSLAKAAELCNLERKTVYDWKKTGYVKLGTKRKVLKALLEHLSRATLNFITRRTYDRAQEALRIYLSTLYEQCVAESKPEQFLQGVAEFETALDHYKALIQPLARDELPLMLYELSRHAQSLGTKWKTRWLPQRETKPSEFSTIHMDVPWTTATTLSLLDKENKYQNYVKLTAKFQAAFLTLMAEKFRQKEILGSEMRQSTAATTGIPPEQRYPSEWSPQILDSVQQELPGEVAVS